VSVIVRFECDGCRAVTDEAPAWRHIGQQVGPSMYLVPTVEGAVNAAAAKVAEGWMIYDEWTRCTYCPACWTCIIEHERPCGEGEPCSMLGAEVAS
jgi:hypothetical protein